MRSNRFGFNIKGGSNWLVVVEAATDLAAANWTAIATNTLKGGVSYFADPAWTNYSWRFYRLSPP